MTLYPRSRFLRNVVSVFCILLMLIAADMIWSQSLRTIHPRYDTTRIVEPTLPDGSIDYLSAIETFFSRGVTPENNAVPLILEALGRVGLPKSQPTDGITSRLGMAHLPETGDYFVTYADFTKARDGKAADLDTDFDGLDRQPVATAASPTVAAWLAANEKPLAKFREATQRSRYFLPFDGGARPEFLFSILLPHLNPIREMSQALTVRALSGAAAGDMAGARQDAVTLHRAARLLNQAATFVERVVGLAIERYACDVDRAIAATSKLSPAQLRDYAAELAALGDVEAPADAVDAGERYMVLDATMRLARLNPVESGRMHQNITSDVAHSGAVPPAFLFPFLPIPYEQSMIDANAWYDGLIAAFRQPTYAQRRNALIRWEKGVNDVSLQGDFGLCSADWALRLFMPNLNRFQGKWEAVRAELRLIRLTLLLAAYKLEHHGYPGSLADLSPGDPKQIPADNFTDRPFIYSRTATGYTLRSPGPNMTDDDGGGDDITANVK